MRQRHALPVLWLMTDPRMGDALWPALERLPAGSAVIFRYYGVADRRALYERVRWIARRRRLLLLLADTPTTAAAWRADGVHGQSPHILPKRLWVRTAPAHDPGEIRRAERRGADAILLSPIHPTRSHPGATALGRPRFGRLARRTTLPVIALGGMTAIRARSLRQLGAYGWAAIDGLSHTGIARGRPASPV